MAERHAERSNQGFIPHPVSNGGRGVRAQVDERSRPKTSSLESVTSSVTDGVTTAALSAAASTTQVVKGSIDGSSIEFPPGSLAVDTTLSIEEGEALDASAADLGLVSGSLQAASLSALVSSSQSVDPLQPFTIQLPLNAAAALALAEDTQTNLVVLYKRIEFNAASQVKLGVLPRALIKIKDGKVRFKTTNFGVFQAMYSTETIDAEKQVVAKGPIVTKKAQTTPLTVAYSASTPTSPANTTSFAVFGTTNPGTAVVELYSDSVCKTSLVKGSKAEFEGAGLTLTIAANTRLEVYAFATAPGRISSLCTKLSDLESDAIAPDAPVVSGSTYTNDVTPTWTWTTPTGASGVFRIKLDDEDLTVGTTETNAMTYTPTTAISQTAHTLYVQARDLAGNWSASGGKIIVVDTSAPVVAIGSPLTAEYVPEATYKIKGTCEADLPIKLTPGNGATSTVTTVTCDAMGNFVFELSHLVAVPAVSTNITSFVAQTDAAGNTATVSSAHRFGLNPTEQRAWFNDQSLQVSGPAVTSWTNRNGSGVNGTVNNTLPKGTVNGKPTASFSGTQAISATSSTLQFDFTTDSVAMFVVYKIPMGNSGVLLSKSSDIENGYTLSVTSDIFALTLGTTLYGPIAPTNDGNTHVLGIISSANTGIVTYVDSTPTAFSTKANPQTSAQGLASNFVIGARNGMSSSDYAENLSAGDIAEVIIIKRALAADERNHIMHYLSEKWGVP